MHTADARLTELGKQQAAANTEHASTLPVEVLPLSPLEKTPQSQIHALLQLSKLKASPIPPRLRDEFLSASDSQPFVESCGDSHYRV